MPTTRSQTWAKLLADLEKQQAKNLAKRDLLLKLPTGQCLTDCIAMAPLPYYYALLLTPRQRLDSAYMTFSIEPRNPKS